MEENKCRHCGGTLSKIALPPASKFESDYLMICLNDDCTYYKRGWDWMQQNFNIRASYRYHYNPSTHSEGPFPVSTPGNLKNMTID